MAQCQHVSNSGPARPPLRRVKRQLPTADHDTGPGRSSKRAVRNQDVNVRRTPRNPSVPGGDSHRLSEGNPKHADSSRAMREGMLAHVSEAASNWSDMATVCSTEDRMNEISSSTWSTSQSTSPNSSFGHDPLDTPSIGRTRSDLSYAGSWADGEPIDLSDPELDIDDWDPQQLGEVPHAPDLGRLATPQLSPVPCDFGFCHCCKSEAQDDGEGRRINGIYRLSHRDKADTQRKFNPSMSPVGHNDTDKAVERALAYMERTRRGADRSRGKTG